MGINSKNDGSNKREEATGKKQQQTNPPIEKVIEDTKNKVRDIQKK